MNWPAFYESSKEISRLGKAGELTYERYAELEREASKACGDDPFAGQLISSLRQEANLYGVAGF